MIIIFSQLTCATISTRGMFPEEAMRKPLVFLLSLFFFFIPRTTLSGTEGEAKCECYCSESQSCNSSNPDGCVAEEDGVLCIDVDNVRHPTECFNTRIHLPSPKGGCAQIWNYRDCIGFDMNYRTGHVGGLTKGRLFSCQGPLAVPTAVLR